MAIKQLYKITIQTPQQSTELLLTKDVVTVGRSTDCEVSIESVGISRKHLRIENKDGELQITDLGSTNGTIYQGIKLKANLPVPYSGDVIYLGPVSDGNKLQLIAETAVNENTRTLTQAKIAAEAARVAASRERERERELSRINAESKPFVQQPKLSELKPSELKLGDQEVKEKSRVSVIAEKPKYGTQSAVVQQPPVQNIISTPVEERILEGMREEIRRLRAEQEDLENALRSAEQQRSKAEDELRRIRQEVEEFESRLASMRERTQEEEDRLKRRMGEIAEKLKTEESIFQNRRDELSHERDALHKLERQTNEERRALEKERALLTDELDKIRIRSEIEIGTAKSKHEADMERITQEQKLERRRLEDEQETLMERLKEEQDKLKRKLQQEAAEERRRCEEDAVTARRKYEDETKEARKKHDEDLAAAKRKFESESVALQERYAQEAATEHKRILEELEADRKRMNREHRALVEEHEKTQSDTQAEIKRLTNELADHLERTTQERAEIDELHRSHLAQVKEQEAKLKAEFEAIEKKHRIQLETLVAEIALKEAQEQKIIEQRKTEKLVAERDLAGVCQQLETAKKELAALQKNVVSVQEQLSDREKAEKEIVASIERHESQQSKLKKEIQKCEETLSEKRTALLKLEADLVEQKKQNQADREAAIQEAEKVKRDIIAQGEAAADAHREKCDAELEKEITAMRAEAKAEAEEDIADWQMELARRKIRETEEMNLWFAEEKRKIQDRLSGDLDNFVETVTSAAMAKLNQDSRFSSLIHEFHSKFSGELRNALTTTEGEFAAQFNPDRKKDTQTFWVKSAVAAVLVIGVAVLARVAPDYIRQAAEQRRISKDDGATGEWIKKIQAEREQRLALKLETRSDFQFSYADNVVYNEGYLEMKLDQHLQAEWVKALNVLMTGEKAMGMDDEALVDYVRIEHAMFIDLADKKSHMNGVNKDEFIKQMQDIAQKGVADLVLVLKTKTLPRSDRARQTTPQQKWRIIREMEQKFYAEHVMTSERRPASK